MKKSVDKFGFSMETMWDSSEPTEQTDRPYNGLQFKVSLFMLSNKLGVDIDTASRRLYDLQKRHIISYQMSESKIFATISKKKVIKYAQSIIGGSTCLYLQAAARPGTYYSWVLDLASRVNAIIKLNCSLASKRVFDVWRIGNIIQNFDENSDKMPGATANSVVGKNSEVADLRYEFSEFISSIQQEDRQRILMDFVCHYYLCHLAPRSAAASPIAFDLTKPKSEGMNWDQMKSLELLFHDIRLPVYRLPMKNSGSSYSSESEKCEYGNFDFLDDKNFAELQLSIRSLLANPLMKELLQLFKFSFCQSGFISKSKYMADILSLIVAKILHGLGSSCLSGSDWPPDIWGRFKNVYFDDILWWTSEYLMGSDWIYGV